MLSKEWLAAWEFTRKNNIKVPALPSEYLASCRYINPEFGEQVLEKLKALYAGKDSRLFVLKCFEVHDKLYSILYDDFGTPCYYTLGWVAYKNEPLFLHTKDEIAVWLKKGVPDKNDARLHCWLTFPSGEILDATLGSVVSINEGKPEEFGAVGWYEDESCGDFVYHPTLVGFEALKFLQLPFDPTSGPSWREKWRDFWSRHFGERS